MRKEKGKKSDTSKREEEIEKETNAKMKLLVE